MASGTKLLVVEDDDAMRDLLVEELCDNGYSALGAATAARGLELAEQERVELVVTDLRMPELDGFDLIRGLVAMARPPHIIMITAFGSIDTAIRAVKLGAYDYITKPFDIEELVLAIEKAMAERGLRQEVEQLRREVAGRTAVTGVVANSQAMRDVMEMVARVAVTTSSVLLTGESGTGKELVARSLHKLSPRSRGPFVAVNLAAVPEALLESELFGHKRGAFTDARTDRDGLFVEADTGTIFLDEIGELALPLQAKLLRVLQEHEVRPLGGSTNRKVDVRVIAATHRNLEAMLAAGEFREDLFYRLNVIGIDLPPLRSRPEDIIPLAAAYLREQGKRQTPARAFHLASDAQAALLAYRWPGNVRELMNVLERGVALARGDEITAHELPPQLREKRQTDALGSAVLRRMTLAELEREYIEKVVADEAGNKTRAAQRLGLDRKTLYRKLEEYARDSGSASVGGATSTSVVSTGGHPIIDDPSK